jgi:hypothetical protein
LLAVLTPQMPPLIPQLSLTIPAIAPQRPRAVHLREKSGLATIERGQARRRARIAFARHYRAVRMLATLPLNLAARLVAGPLDQS